MRIPWLCLLIAPLALLAAPSAQAQPAQKQLPTRAVPRVDPRADAALKRMVAAYKKLGEFSLTSLDTSSALRSGSNRTLQSRSLGRLGRNRFALRMENLQTQQNLLTRLNTGQEFFQSSGGRPAWPRLIANLKSEEAQDAGPRFFQPSFGLRIVSLSLQLNPFRLPKGSGTISSVRYRTRPDGTSQIEARGQFVEGDQRFDLIYLFSIGGDNFLQKAELRLQGGRERITQTARLSRPIPLASPDAFRWEALAPRNPNFVISPASRALFERAARLYGAAKTLRVTAQSQVEQGGKIQREGAVIEWERRGLLRFEFSDRDLVVVDGNAKWDLQNGAKGGAEGATFTREPLDKKDKSAAVLEALGAPDEVEGVGLHFSQWLRGEMPFLSSLEEYTHLRAEVLESAPWQGEICDRVQLTVRTTGIGKLVPSFGYQSTFWFAQSDGRWVRAVDKVNSSKEKPKISEVNLTHQELNVPFTAGRFKWTPPAGAQEMVPGESFTLTF